MNKPATLDSSWTGLLQLAPMVSMFAGEGGDTTEHFHPAHKVVIGAHSVTHSGTEFNAAAIAIPTGVPHRLFASGAQVVVAFLDARRFEFDDVQRHISRSADRAVGLDNPKGLLREFATLPQRQLQKRLILALDALAEGKSIAEAAQLIRISHSRLTHLLNEQLGTSPSTWKIWVRFRDAIDKVATGSSVTEAAHSAGFADASHFSRSCHSNIRHCAQCVVRWPTNSHAWYPLINFLNKNEGSSAYFGGIS